MKVDFDVIKFQQDLDDYADQINYAMSVAINETAKEVQKDIRAHIDDTFTVRRKAFINNSVKIKPFSTKRTLTATISISTPGNQDRSDILSKFEDQTSKQSVTGGLIAIPNRALFDSSKVIPTGKRPRNLPNGFKIKMPNGEQYIMTTVGRGKQRRLIMAYHLVNQVKLKPNLDFVKTATSTVNRVWATKLDEAWTKAKATSDKSQRTDPTQPSQ